MSAEQMRELILDLYSARKECKEYFEFYLDPNIEKLTETYMAKIQKEIYRTKRGYMVARFSHLRNFIKEYESYGPGADNVLKLMIDTFKLAVVIERHYYAKPAFVNGTIKLGQDILKYGDKHLLFDTAIKSVTEQLPVATLAVRNPLKEYIAQM